MISGKQDSVKNVGKEPIKRRKKNKHEDKRNEKKWRQNRKK